MWLSRKTKSKQVKIKWKMLGLLDRHEAQQQNEQNEKKRRSYIRVPHSYLIVKPRSKQFQTKVIVSLT